MTAARREHDVADEGLVAQPAAGVGIGGGGRPLTAWLGDPDVVSAGRGCAILRPVPAGGLAKMPLGAGHERDR